jgi:hypothetical protein
MLRLSLVALSTVAIAVATHRSAQLPGARPSVGDTVQAVMPW